MMSLVGHHNLKILSFDDTGELILENRTPKTSCRVCPKTLARVSPFFKAMLYAGFAESKPQHGDWVVRLPEDKITGCSIILNIIHGHADKVPVWSSDFAQYLEPGKTNDSPPLNMIYETAWIADKYNLVHLLPPWAVS